MYKYIFQGNKLITSLSLKNYSISIQIIQNVPWKMPQMIQNLTTEKYSVLTFTEYHSWQLVTYTDG